MKPLSKKKALLFAAVVSACALAVAPVAAASSWAPIGSTHQLSSSDLTFKWSAGIGSFGWTCADSELHADVVIASVMAITGARFSNCTGTFSAAGCTITMTGTQFPWIATAPTTTDIQLHRIHLDARFEGFCTRANLDVTLTGTLSGESWDPSAVGADRRITLTNAFTPGLTAHSPGLGSPSVSGSFRDTTGTLDLLM